MRCYHCCASNKFIKNAYTINFALLIVTMVLYLVELFAEPVILHMIASATDQPKKVIEMSPSSIVLKYTEWLITIVQLAFTCFIICREENCQTLLAQYVTIASAHVFSVIISIVCAVIDIRAGGHDLGLLLYFLIIRAVLFLYFVCMCSGILMRYCLTGSTKRRISVQNERNKLLLMHDDEKGSCSTVSQPSKESTHYKPAHEVKGYATIFLDQRSTTVKSSHVTSRTISLDKQNDLVFREFKIDE